MFSPDRSTKKWYKSHHYSAYQQLRDIGSGRFEKNTVYLIARWTSADW